MHFLFFPLASATAPPVAQVVGDAVPPGYPVIRVHLEVPPSTRDFHVYEDLVNYERSVIVWRENQLHSMRAVSRHLDELLNFFSTREKLTSFLQGIPGLDIFEKMGKSFSSGFSGGLPPQNNIGPFPVFNFQVEEVQRRNFQVNSTSNSSALEAMLLKEQTELQMWRVLFNQPKISLLQGLPVNYIEDDPLPNTHIDVALESIPVVEGEYVPDLSLPSKGDIEAAVIRAKASAQLAALTAVVRALALR